MKKKAQRQKAFLELLEPTEIDRVLFNGQVRFQVFAWMVPKRTYEVLERDFREMTEWVHNNVWLGLG